MASEGKGHKFLNFVVAKVLVVKKLLKLSIKCCLAVCSSVLTIFSWQHRDLGLNEDETKSHDKVAELDVSHRVISCF